jgi:hypothetical protein
MALGSAAMRAEWAAYECQRNLDLAEIGLLGRSPVRIINFTEPLWQALEMVLVHYDYGLASIVSSYLCRDIAGTNLRSLHSYKLAVDIDPARNARQADRRGQGNDWTRTKLTEEQCVAIEAIRLVNGEQAFRSGALSFTTPDAMHFQLSCTQDGARSGVDWSTVDGYQAEELDMWPKQGDVDDSGKRDFRVEHWQLKLAALEGHPYISGDTNTPITAAGMVRGTYNEAMKALVARYTDRDGTAIGPAQESQINAKLDTTGGLEGFAEVSTTLLMKNAGG